ncbi:hypothetical protein Bbelb_079660 [Branchiostoma belcheri]|nr:hypothetical protein Bbelb_079660 [Branchiostoma belcheri]
MERVELFCSLDTSTFPQHLAQCYSDAAFDAVDNIVKSENGQQIVNSYARSPDESKRNYGCLFSRMLCRTWPATNDGRTPPTDLKLLEHMLTWQPCAGILKLFGEVSDLVPFLHVESENHIAYYNSLLGTAVQKLTNGSIIISHLQLLLQHRKQFLELCNAVAVSSTKEEEESKDKKAKGSGKRDANMVVKVEDTAWPLEQLEKVLDWRGKEMDAIKMETRQIECFLSMCEDIKPERELAKKLKPLERRTHKFTKSGEQFKEVSAAFLSHFETHRGKSTNPLHGLEHYSVKHNTSCLTVHIPSESIASWKSVCEAYYGVKGTDRGVNGVQFSTTFTDDDMRLGTELGSLHITIFDTSKLLIQGTSYVLWLVSQYSILQGMVLSDIAERYPGNPPSAPSTCEQTADGLYVMCEESITVCVVCNKQEDDGDEFVGCSDCTSWTHFDCTGLDESTKSVLRNTEEKYFCINCHPPRVTPTLENQSLEKNAAGPSINTTKPTDKGNGSNRPQSW